MSTAPPRLDEFPILLGPGGRTLPRSSFNSFDAP